MTSLKNAFIFILFIYLALSITACKQTYIRHYTDRIDPLLQTELSDPQPTIFTPYGLIQLSPVTYWEENSSQAGRYQSEARDKLAFEHFNLLRKTMPTHPDLRIHADYQNQSATSALRIERELSAVGRYATLQKDNNNKELRTEISAGTYTSIIEFILDTKTLTSIHLSPLSTSNESLINISRPDSFYLSLDFIHTDLPLHCLVRFSLLPTDIITSNGSLAIGDSLKEISLQTIDLVYETDEKKRQVLINTSFSRIDSDQVIRNFESESKGWWLEGVIQANKDAWKTHLSKFQLYGGKEEDQIQFFTYHYRLMRNLAFLTESAGRFPTNSINRSASKDLFEERFSWYGENPNNADLFWLRTTEAVAVKRLGLDFNKNLPLRIPTPFADIAKKLEETDIEQDSSALKMDFSYVKPSVSATLLKLSGIVPSSEEVQFGPFSFSYLQIFMGGNATYLRTEKQENLIDGVPYSTWFLNGMQQSENEQ